MDWKDALFFWKGEFVVDRKSNQVGESSVCFRGTWASSTERTLPSKADFEASKANIFDIRGVAVNDHRYVEYVDDDGEEDAIESTVEADSTTIKKKNILRSVLFRKGYYALDNGEGHRKYYDAPYALHFLTDERDDIETSPQRIEIVGVGKNEFAPFVIAGYAEKLDEKIPKEKVEADAASADFVSHRSQTGYAEKLDEKIPKEKVEADAASADFVSPRSQTRYRAVLCRRYLDEADDRVSCEAPEVLFREIPSKVRERPWESDVLVVSRIRKVSRSALKKKKKRPPPGDSSSSSSSSSTTTPASATSATTTTTTTTTITTSKKKRKTNREYTLSVLKTDPEDPAKRVVVAHKTFETSKAVVREAFKHLDDGEFVWYVDTRYGSQDLMGMIDGGMFSESDEDWAKFATPRLRKVGNKITIDGPLDISLWRSA
eukprot:g72.t1